MAGIGVKARLARLRDVLRPICPPETFDDIVRTLENPLQNRSGIKVLESLLGRLSDLQIPPDQFNSIKTLLEDELIGAKLICQDAKCDPTRCSTSHHLERKFQ